MMETPQFVSKLCFGLFVACLTCSVQAKPVNPLFPFQIGGARGISPRG